MSDEELLQTLEQAVLSAQDNIPLCVLLQMVSKRFKALKACAENHYC